MDKIIKTRQIAIAAGILMTALATSVQAMPFCGKSNYRSHGYPHHIVGYSPAPAWYGPAYYGYGQSVPNAAYPQQPIQPLPQANNTDRQAEGSKAY